jgi:hypothetical protein
MTPNYFKAIMQDDWPDLESQLDWLKPRCDSKLEILFGLSLLRAHSQFGFNYNGDTSGWVYDTEAAMCLAEPFAASPSLNGQSIAYLTCQQQHNGRSWDFGIWVGGDNGAKFDECRLFCLVDVDGWLTHRGQRMHDSKKLESATITTIRVIEEEYLTMQEAAEDVLLSTIYSSEGPVNHKLIITR